MGVAVGRSTCKDGLQIQNYNSMAAKLQHPYIVSDFYEKGGKAMIENNSCCRKRIGHFPCSCHA